MGKVRTKFDKSLNKYHIEYAKEKAKSDYRYEVFKKMNLMYDLYFAIETHLGSVNKPDPLTYTKQTETKLSHTGIKYQVRPMEVRNEKQLFGFLAGKKKTITDYCITFVLHKGELTRELFDEVLCEFDLQVGYDIKVDQQTFFEDLLKGYVDGVTNVEYFNNSFFDSRIFDKFLATEDLTQL